MRCSNVTFKSYIETEEADDGEWTIEEVIEKFQQSREGILWRTALNQGVHLDETFFEEHVARKTSEEYIARYDLTYLTPGAHEIRCKVKHCEL